MTRPIRRAGLAAGLTSILAFAAVAANAAPSILMDASTGDVLQQQDATQSWFPASTTKLMTVYVALDAVASGRLTLDTPLVVSPRAARMAPSKMGFKPGTQVTLDNALKMLMVKSANDIAVTIAEGVGGSVEAFADEMNATAAKIGMRESRFVNPNGLPDARHVSSARDLAVLARALLMRFPEHSGLYNIGAMRLGTRIFPTHNGLLGRYPGADGMKTGFTCAAGFNIVASVTRGGRRLISVVLGAPSATARTMKAVSMFEKGFSGQESSQGNALSLASAGITAAPDMHDDVCRNRGKANAQYMAEIEDMSVPLQGDTASLLSGQPERSFLALGAAQSGSVQGSAPAPGSAVASMPRPVYVPIDVFVGPVAGWTGPVAHPVDYAGPPTGPRTAYAPAKAEGDSPLQPADDALPMKSGKGAKHAKAKAAKAKIVVAHNAPKAAVKHKIAAKPKPEKPKAAKHAAGAKTAAKTEGKKPAAQ